MYDEHEEKTERRQMVYETNIQSEIAKGEPRTVRRSCELDWQQIEKDINRRSQEIKDNRVLLWENNNRKASITEKDKRQEGTHKFTWVKESLNENESIQMSSCSPD